MQLRCSLRLVLSRQTTARGSWQSFPMYFEVDRDIESGEKSSNEEPDNSDSNSTGNSINGLMLMFLFLSLRFSKIPKVAGASDGNNLERHVKESVIDLTFALALSWIIEIHTRDRGTRSLNLVIWLSGKR